MTKLKGFLTCIFSVTAILCFSFNSYAVSYGQSPQYTHLGDVSSNGELGINPFSGGIKNCHFYTWGRVYEMHGIKLGAGVVSWQKDYILHQEPRAHSMALWGTSTNTSHSAYVEAVNADGSKITFSEGGNIYSDTGYAYNSEINLTTFKGWSYDKSPLLGFIYFDNSPITSTLSVTTTTADNITATNATVRGEVSYTGELPSEYGIYFGTDKNSLTKVAHDGRPDFSYNPFKMWYDLQAEAGITLQPNTTYYWKCYAIQNGIEVTGDIQSFRTITTLTVTTTTADSITATNATVRGEVSYSGELPSEYGIYFGTDSNNLKKVAHDGRPDFSYNPFKMWYDLQAEAGITLQPNTTYYWKCYAIQNGIEVTGGIQSFRTLATLIVNTTTADSITSTNATVRGEVSYSGELPSEYGIYFGTDSANLRKVAHDGRPNFSYNPFKMWYDLQAEAGITLQPNTIYYWKCYAIQNGIEVAGTIQSFRTLATK